MSSFSKVSGPLSTTGHESHDKCPANQRTEWNSQSDQGLSLKLPFKLFFSLQEAFWALVCLCVCVFVCVCVCVCVFMKKRPIPQMLRRKLTHTLAIALFVCLCLCV